MKRKEMIKQIYWVAGVLEGLSYDGSITEAVAIALGDCVTRLELIGAQLIEKDVHEDEEKLERNIYQMESKRIMEACGRVYPAPQEAE